jgi:hypothetical protein
VSGPYLGGKEGWMWRGSGLLRDAEREVRFAQGYPRGTVARVLL